MGAIPLIVPCHSCGRALSFEEGGHRAEAVTCPECGAKVRAPPGPAPWEDAEPDPVPSDPDWFVLLQAKQVGPLDARAMVERIRTGEVHGRTFVWRDGFDGWRRALEVPELVPLLEDAGFPSTPPHGPLTPAEGISSPGARTPPRASTPKEIAPVRHRRPDPAPVVSQEPVEELELARPPRRRGRPLPTPDSDFVRSGLHRRSPWKLALALSAALILPVGGFAMLVRLRGGQPIVEAHGDQPSGQPAQPETAAPTPVRRVQELRDLLTGKKPPPEAAPAPAAVPPQTPARHTADAKSPAKPGPDGPKTAELRALYGDSAKPDVGPRVHRSDSAASSHGGGGPSGEEVARVVGQTQSAFQSCIEQQLRKNPGFRGGKVSLVATIGGSGTVKQVTLDRRDLEGTDLGTCLKARAKRMVFSAFNGDDVDVEIPLVLTTSL
jgi:hypothetical protein